MPQPRPPARRFAAAPALPLPAALALACALFLGLPPAARAQSPQPGEAPRPAVIAAPVAEEPVRAPQSFIGRVEAVRVLDLVPQVQGVIEEVAFTEGAAVEAGQLMLRLDPAQYEAQLAQAEAQRARAEAARQEAVRSLARQRELARGNIVSRATLDESEANATAAAAELRAAEAAVRMAELNLAYTRVEAGIAGRVGRALFTRGALVGPQSGPLARIVQLDPIRVVFSLTESEWIGFRQAQTDSAAWRLTLRLPNGRDYPLEGRPDFVGSEVNPGTGTVPVRIAFDNPDTLLLPGQFVTLQVAERDPPRLPMVPFSAVQQDREGRSVFVLNGEGVVARRRIAVGPRLARGWAVTEGLAPGETVVLQGGQRLRDGMAVRAVAPEGAREDMPEGAREDMPQGGRGDRQDGAGRRP